MAKVVGVFVLGLISAASLMALTVYLIAFIVPRQLDMYLYLFAAAAIGVAVGLIVGTLQHTKAGILAIVCLLPVLALELWHSPRLASLSFGFSLFIVGQLLELTLAFFVAQSISTKKKRAAPAIQSNPSAR